MLGILLELCKDLSLLGCHEVGHGAEERRGNGLVPIMFSTYCTVASGAVLGLLRDFLDCFATYVILRPKLFLDSCVIVLYCFPNYVRLRPNLFLDSCVICWNVLSLISYCVQSGRMRNFL